MIEQLYNWLHNHGGHPKTATEQQLRQAVADNPKMLRRDLPRFEATA